MSGQCGNSIRRTQSISPIASGIFNSILFVCFILHPSFYTFHSCDDNVHACGVDGDGLIRYPFAWIVEGTGYQIGPWDCMSTGMKLTTDQCCDFIKASVPFQDDRGRNIQCHVTPDERLHPEADPNTIIIPFDPITHSVAGVPHTN